METTMITEKENQEMLRIEEMVEMLRDLNPHAFFRIVPVLFGAEKFIEGNLPIEKLKLPEGCHYDSDRIMQAGNIYSIDGFFYTN